MSGRKYKSGAEKRKLLINREKEKNKCAKISTFFTLEQSSNNITNADVANTSSQGNEVERNLAEETGEIQQANLHDENMQDLDSQQPSEKDVVQPEDINNASSTEKCLENVGFDFEKYADVGSWRNR